MLRHNPPPQRGFFAWFNRQVDAVTRGFGHAVELVIKRAVVALVLFAVFLWSIWHLFSVLPTSFVPNEDQGYVMAAIIMPEAASLDRTQAVAEKVDAIFARTPGVETRAMITGYSLLDSGFKTNAGTFFVTLKDFKERYATTESARTQNARAVLVNLYREAQAIEEAIVFPVAPPAIPGIGTTGGFEFWIQDTGAGDPARLDAVTKDFVAKARARAELASLTSTFRANTQQLRADRRPRQGHAARRPGRGRLQRDPGAVRLADREPVQPVQPRLVGDRPVRCPVPAEARGPHAPVHAVQGRQDGPAVGAGQDRVGRRAGPPPALQRLSRGEGQRQPGAREQLGRRDRRDGGGRAGGAAAGLHVRVVRPRLRGEEVRRHVDDRVRVRPHHRLPGAGRAVRVVDAAGRGDVGGAVRDPRRARHQLGCAASRTTSTSRSASWC